MQFLHSSIALSGDCAVAAFDYVHHNETHIDRVIKMAFVNATRTSSNDLSIAVGVYGLISRLTALSARYADYRAYRETVTELSKLSSRELADLGLSRGTIASVAHEAVYGTRI
jgi:uncharacterized protein YjiS (DUF1127 family)